jgi:hypothetical protein
MILDDDQISEYLFNLRQQLLEPAKFRSIALTREWANGAPNEAGVYVLKEKENIIYVGETGNLRGRMRDLLDSRNHIVRRTIGATLYSSHAKFQKATASLKFPEVIEALVNNHICGMLRVSYLAVNLGRKELEELIQSSIPEGIRLNKRGKRIKR